MIEHPNVATEIRRLRAEVESLQALVVKKDEALVDYDQAVEWLNCCYADDDLDAADGWSKVIKAQTLVRRTLSLTPADLGGCVVVPMEPTKEMLQAAYACDRDGTTPMYHKVYRAMIAAAGGKQDD